jgi:hypothetical protein
MNQAATFFDRNIEVLKHRHVWVYGSLLNGSEYSGGGKFEAGGSGTGSSGTAADGNGKHPDTLRVSDTASGYPTLRTETGAGALLFHSATDPVKESRRIAESRLEGIEDLIVVAGIGLGYLPEAVLNRCPEATVVIAEPNPDIMLTALKSRDLRCVLQSDRVHLLVPDRECEPGAWRIPYEMFFAYAQPFQVRFLTSRTYRSLYGAFIDTWEQELLDFHRRSRINTATLNRFDRLWTRNTFHNAPCFFSQYGVDVLRGALQGYPAVVIGAGPSLERDWEILAEASDRVVLIASDSALLPLLRRGVVPDFVVTIDPQYINSIALCSAASRMTGPGPILIADPAVYPTTLRCFPGTSILTSSVFSPGSIIERFSGKLGKIAAGGSVMTTAFDFARLTGAGPVYLMGLDLSYRGIRTHITGSFMEDAVHLRSSRLSTVETVYARCAREGKPVPARTRSGENIMTDSRLLLYKSWFERQQVNGDVFNATRGGLDIKGIPETEPGAIRNHAPSKKGKPGALPPDEDKQLPPKDSTIDRLRCLYRKRQLDREGANSFISYIASVKANLLELCEIARQGAEAALGNGAETLRTLEETDKSLLGFKEENLLISMVMQGTINEILNSRPHKGGDSGRRLYLEISDACRVLCEQLDLASLRVKQLT